MREPMAWTGAAVVLGAVLWPWWRPELIACLVGVLALSLLAIAAQGRAVAWLALIAAAFLLGSGAAEPARTAPATTWVSGRVERTVGSEAWVETSQGRLRLRLPEPASVGERLVALTGPLSPPALLPGAVSAAPDDARAGASPRRARAVVAEGGTTASPDRFALAEHGGLLRALATGDRTGIDEPTRELLRRTGTAHLLSISGLHVGLMAGTVGGLGWLLLRPLALTRAWRLASVLPTLLAAASAVAYAMSVGAPASARRAAVMVVAATLTSLLGRRPRPWTLLGLAAALVVLVEPGLVGDLGFQLSFSAVAGMLLVVPRFTRLVPPDSPRSLSWLVGGLAATVGATAGTLPFVALHFQQLSPLSPLANLIATPLLGSVAVPASLLALLLPGDLGLLALAVGDSAIDLGLRGLAAVDVEPWAPAVGIGGAALLSGAVLLRRHPAAAACLALVALGLRLVPTDRLVITFLAVGQGDAALVEWPDGRRWLVDGGPSSDQVLRYLRRRGLRRLDAVVLSHAHDDHQGGLLPVLESLPVRALWVPRPPQPEEEAYGALWEAAKAQGSTLVLPDDVPVRGLSGARVEHPRSGWRAHGRDAINDESLVLRLDHGAHRVIFTGDVEAEAEELLARVLGPMTLVKVAHHGSRSSSSPAFVARTRPALAVVSAGRENRFRHPHPDTLAAWTLPATGSRCGGLDTDGRSCRTRLVRTDLEGSLEWSSDGRRWRLRAWRAASGWVELDVGR